MKMANTKLKSCKTCGAEVAKSAKTCPHCGAKLKKGHPLLIGILAFIVLAGILGSSGGSDEPKKVETSSSAQTAQTSSSQVSAPKTSFSVGETAELNDVLVSLVNVSESTGSAYNEPTEGNIFVICEFEIANNSDKEINVSSMISFEAYCDDYACTYSLGALLEKENKNQLDGTVAPGKKFNGVIGYEVSTDWKELEVHFSPDFLSGKDIIFIATNN